MTIEDVCGSSLIASLSAASPPEPGCTMCTVGSRVGSSESIRVAPAVDVSSSTAESALEMTAPLSVWATALAFDSYL